MNKKSRLLKRWTRTIAYLTVIAALVSFIEPISAGWIREWNDNNVPPRRMVQVDFGITNRGVDNYPNAPAKFVPATLTDDNTVRTYMKNTLPSINGETHIQFWLSQHETLFEHAQRALFGVAGAQENAYISAINAIPHGAPIVPANVTFSLHVKNDQ